MKNHIKGVLIKNTSQFYSIIHIEFIKGELRTPLQLFNIIFTAIRQIIDDNNLVTIFDEPFTDVTANKTSSAGY